MCASTHVPLVNKKETGGDSRHLESSRQAASNLGGVSRLGCYLKEARACACASLYSVRARVVLSTSLLDTADSEAKCALLAKCISVCCLMW